MQQIGAGTRQDRQGVVIVLLGVPLARLVRGAGDDVGPSLSGAVVRHIEAGHAILATAILFGLSFWKAWDTNASYIPLILLVIAAVVVALFAEYAAPLQARFANTTGRLFSLSAMFPWRAFPCSLVLVVIDVLAAGLSYFVPFIRVLAILFGIAWVAYAKSLILLWGFKRYGGTGKVENPQYVNAHE